MAVGEAALGLKRTYNHHSDAFGLFRSHWISNFDYRLSFNNSASYPIQGACYPRPGAAPCTSSSQDTILWAHRPDGRKILFLKGTDGIYHEDRATPVAQIVRQANGGWILYSELNDVETYAASGLPISIKNAFGIGWTFSHGGLNGTQLQQVTHTSGRYVKFIWTGDKLAEVRDPANAAYLFSYDVFGKLKTVTLPGSPVTVVTYHYAGESGEPTRGGLTGKTFNGVRYSWFTYDASFRADSTQHFDGADKYSFVYTLNSDGTRKVVETNPLGKTATLFFDSNENLTEIIGQASAHCAGASRGSNYDVNGNPDVVTDFNGNAVDYDYTAKGQLLKQVEAVGKPEARTTMYVWDAAKNRITSYTVAGLSKTDYGYKLDGRPGSLTVTNLSANGVANQARTTSYAYTNHTNGMIKTKTIDGPLPGAGDAIVYTYDQYGNLLTVANSLGQTVT